MPDYVLVFLNKQGSRYAYVTKYAKTKILTKFWIWQGSQHASVSQRSECTWIFLAWQNSECILGSKYAIILNMKQLHRVLSMPQYGLICLNWTWIYLKMSGFMIINRLRNMHHAIHSQSTSWWVLIERYWEPVTDLRWSALEK